MKDKTVTGHIDGIRKTALEDMQDLYALPAGENEYLNEALVPSLCAHTAALNREIAVYLDRSGEILDVKVGTADRVNATPKQKRRSSSGLSAVRCVHTHPGGDPTLSDADLSMMRNLKMDSICALGVGEDGHLTGIRAAFWDADGQDLTQAAFKGAAQLNASDWAQRTREAEQAVKARIEEDTGPEKAILISINRDDPLDELKALAEASGAIVVKKVWQNKPVKDSATYIGPGKAEEVRMDAQVLNADLVIVDDELSGKQICNLEDRIGIKVIDRTTLILDIFAQRALSDEGKTQVAAAQARYRSQKLIGQGLVLSRLGGGIGTRGPGETQLEMDRRAIRRQLKVLEDRLNKIEAQRTARRKQREKNEIPIVALVGYTNTGKSTLMNRLSHAGVLVKDQLFATLDAVSKKVTEGDVPFILVDTVGFIDKLPHDLVKAFRSTLEEAALADVLVLVHDASDEKYPEHRQTVLNVLDDLGATDQPRIEVMNKVDKVSGPIPLGDNAVAVSATEGDGIDDLLDKIRDLLREGEKEYSVFVPYAQFGLAASLSKYGRVITYEDGPEGRRITIAMKDKDRQQAEKKLGIAFSLKA